MAYINGKYVSVFDVYAAVKLLLIGGVLLVIYKRLSRRVA